MTTLPSTRHLGVIVIALFEAILILGLTRGYDWGAFSFGFAASMVLIMPVMFIVEARLYRRARSQE